MPEHLHRVVVDTSVWVSALLNPPGPPGAVLNAFLNVRFTPVVSDALLDEIRRVVTRPRIRARLRTSPERLAMVLARLEDLPVAVDVSGTLGLCRDPTDDFLLETALAGRADYLVTRDDDLKRDLDLIHHLRQRGVDVLSVAQFLKLLDREPS